MQMLLDKIKDFVYSIDDHLVRWGKGLLALTAGTAMAAGGGAVADQQASPYMQVDADTRAVSIKQDLENAGEAQVRINNNRPEATLEKWNGEVQMSVSADIQATANRPLMSQKLRYEGRGNRSVIMQPTEDGFKIDGEFKQKPADNTFTFNIDGAENLDFFYQPALDEANPNENCTATTCFDENNATTTHRPENIVGSYAVYHKTKKGHRIGDTNYATGKAFHIYRPKIVDDAGNETWGEMRYQDGELTVTVPQEFLNKAVYPVVVDPTFGYETAGGSSRSHRTNDHLDTSEFTLSENGELTKLTAYLSATEDSTPAHSDAGYHRKTGTGEGTFLASTPDGTSTGAEQISTNGGFSAQWKDFPFNNSQSITADTYFLGFNQQATGNPFGGFSEFFIHYDDTGSSNQGGEVVMQNGNTTEWVDFSQSDFNNLTNRQYSIYATYTADGGGGGGGVTPQSIYMF